MNTADLTSLPINEKIGQMFVIGIPGPEIDDATRKLLLEVQPGGVCLFSRNLKNAVQTRKLLDSIRSVLTVEPILCVDQEGGLVDRLRRIITPMPAPSSIPDVESASMLGSIVGETLRILGFNLNFAPVVDVSCDDRAKASNGLFSRTFGNSEIEAAEFAGGFLSAMQEGGCIGCLKHFPGLGASTVDSHEELPTVILSYEELDQIDLFPYRKLLPGAKAVMVAHASYPKIDLQETDQNGRLLPSSLSYAFVTQLLRNELNFNGVIITDDLEMGAILKNYGIDEACRLAIGAGNDMLSICAEPDRIRAGFHAIVAAVNHGTIAEDRIDQSLNRISEIKALIEPALSFNEARLSTLSTEIEKLKDRLN